MVPFKKPAGGALLEWQKQFNAGLNSPRAAVERAVAHLKNWKMLKTRYRAPLHKFSSALRAIVDCISSQRLLNNVPGLVSTML